MVRNDLQGREPPSPLESKQVVHQLVKRFRFSDNYIYYMFTLGRKPFHRHLDDEKRETESTSDRKTFSPSGIAATGTVSLQFASQRNGDTSRSWAGNCFTQGMRMDSNAWEETSSMPGRRLAPNLDNQTHRNKRQKRKHAVCNSAFACGVSFFGQNFRHSIRGFRGWKNGDNMKK